MKVLYDSQTFTGQRFGGISGYFNELITNSCDYFDYEVSGRVSNNIYVSSFSSMKPFFDGTQFKGKLKLMKAINRKSDKEAIEKGNYDIFHPTYYEAITYPKDKPVIITAHDFISELMEDGKDPELTEYKRSAFIRADQIICISKNTQNDLLRLFPEISETKTTLVYHGLPWEVKAPLSTDRSYLLFTGTRGTYKNFQRFVKAIASLLETYDLNLLCTGHDFNDEELKLFETLHISERVTHYFARNEAELQELYQKALLFIFPSVYEGFGFPILEAFASSCPVILSNTSCFPEIAGDAGIYFDPYQEDAIYEAVKHALDHSSLREEQIQKGKERLKDFTVDRMVGKTAEVYRSVCE